MARHKRAALRAIKLFALVVLLIILLWKTWPSRTNLDIHALLYGVLLILISIALSFLILATASWLNLLEPPKRKKKPQPDFEKIQETLRQEAKIQIKNDQEFDKL